MTKIIDKPSESIPNNDNQMPSDDFAKVTPEESLWASIVKGYTSSTSIECKALDSYLAFTVIVGINQMIYCALTKGAAYNSFVGAFSSSVGSFVFAGNARLQLSRKEPISYEDRAHIITEFIICSIILNLFVANVIN